MIKNITKKTEQLSTFMQELVAHPRKIGALWPSSPYLAREMVRYVQLKKDEFVVELGPGTGVITEELIKRCAPEQVIAIEYSEIFAEKLHQQFPKIKAIQGNALHLNELLAPYAGRITHIISSLPLRVFPLEITQSILTQIEALLPVGGFYVQFTYGWQARTYGQLTTFGHLHGKRVWRNFPPARVDVWVKI